MPEHETKLTEDEKQKVEENSPPAAKVVHASVSKTKKSKTD